MSGQELVQAPSGGEWNVIKGQLRDFSTNNVFNFEVRIKDEVAMVYADDRNFIRKMVRTENRKGNMNIAKVPGQNLAVEKFPGKKKDEITKDLLKKLKAGGANITKQ